MNYNITYSGIERRIRTNDFENKEELSRYIIDLKNRGFISQEQITQLLSLYDELHNVTDMPLDMEKYKGVGLENQSLIVSTETDQILKTMEGHEDISKEFKKVQNEIIANSDDALSNADTIFKHMASTQKEEVNLIPLSEIHTKENIDLEILQKIRYFISNKYINPYAFRVDIESGIFYNMETSEVLEVRKNETTNQYQIYRGSEIVYGESYQNEESPDNTDQMVNEDRSEEEKAYENRNKPITRTLRPPQIRHYDNAAFSKMNFLILIIVMFTATITFITLLSKFIK